MKSLTLQIASISDRKNVVSEIWFGNDQVAEISSEDGQTTQIEIFPAPHSGAWTFDLDAFQAILTEAKHNLRNA
ncbi:hypothetical protein [Herbaspirillum sp. YR522]|uniref:hypothetical protein n=1 Tax=Herbaspirillum sp. YR522 TaxID=1144342 RepID=UPI0009DB1E53|nr:hypothetical protein [Herbaspirillum sp. YR522]